MRIFFILILGIYSGIAGVISGNLTEKSTGEYVIGGAVAIYNQASQSDSSALSAGKFFIQKKPIKGAYSNKYGFYSLPNIEPGTYILIARGVSYEIFAQKVTIEEDSEINLNIELETKDIYTDEVKVTASRDFGKTENISKVDIDPNFIKTLPSIGSEVDVFRALQLLPGVSSASELSSGLYVRGGSPDQNLVLLDDVIVYNPAHMGGFLSVFNSDALNSISLIKGSMPAKYGGRMSSVLDMQMKEGNSEKYTGAGSVSILSSKITAEGPINDNSSFMVSGRYFYLGKLISFIEGAPDYTFYDFNAKVNYKLSDKDQLFISGYFGNDNFDIGDSDTEDFDFIWGNETFNARWKHVASPVFFTNFSLIYTNYNSTLSIRELEDSFNNTEEYFFETVSDIRDFTIRGNAEYFGIDDHLISFGFEATNHDFLARVASNENTEELSAFIGDRKISAFDAALYAMDEWRTTEDLSINFGGRMYYFGEGDYLGFEPRLAASYNLNPSVKLVGSYSVAHQFLHLISRNDISLPSDLWFPSTENIKPGRGTQGVLGVHSILPWDLDLQIEGYYKHMDNVYEYREDALFSLGIPLDDQFTGGFGWSYGVEFLLRRSLGNFTGWIGYTWSKTQRKLEEINNGNSYFPRYDRRHDISVTGTYRFNKRLEVGAVWVYATGQAFTMPNGSFLNNPEFGYDFGGVYLGESFAFTERNGFRLPAFHRFDLNLIYKYETFGIPVEWSLNIYNLYNRRNAFAWFVADEAIENPETGTFENQKVVKQLTLFPIIPSIGFRFEF